MCIILKVGVFTCQLKPSLNFYLCVMLFFNGIKSIDLVTPYEASYSTNNRVNFLYSVNVYNLKSNVNTWIVCKEANGDPTSRRNTNNVPFSRINKIETSRILDRIIISKSVSNHKEIETMKVKWMTFSTDVKVLVN